MVLVLAPLEILNRIRHGGTLQLLRSRDGRIAVRSQPELKVSKTSSQLISQAWWYIPVIQLHENHR